MLCAGATGFVKENSRIKEDTAMGIVFSGMFALGVVLYVATPTDVHLDHILFGDALGVTWADVGKSAAIALPVAAAVLVARRGLLLHAFDPAHARAIGLPVRLLHYGLLALVALTVVAALQAVGIILAIAVLIAPGAIAFLWVPPLRADAGGRGDGGGRRRARSASTRASGSTPLPRRPSSSSCRSPSRPAWR